MPTFSDAIVLAAQAHHGKQCKENLPYIFHPMRVANRVLRQHREYDENLWMTAILHDVIENTEVTLDDLKTQGYPSEVLEALQYLTKLPEEEDIEGDSVDVKHQKYFSFIERLAKGPSKLARRVKIASLEDNLDVDRLICGEGSNDLIRCRKYQRALKILRQSDYK
jgi:(p)ppGpp synthase/HD superfamily hydrolase